jgi:hypothetical protein
MPKMASKKNELDDILDTIDEAVRFVLHAMCLSSVGEGQTGDTAAKMVVERVSQRLSSKDVER